MRTELLEDRRGPREVRHGLPRLRLPEEDPRDVEYPVLAIEQLERLSVSGNDSAGGSIVTPAAALNRPSWSTAAPKSTWPTAIRTRWRGAPPRGRARGRRSPRSRGRRGRRRMTVARRDRRQRVGRLEQVPGADHCLFARPAQLDSPLDARYGGGVLTEARLGGRQRGQRRQHRLDVAHARRRADRDGCDSQPLRTGPSTRGSGRRGCEPRCRGTPPRHPGRCRRSPVPPPPTDR